MLGLAPLPPIPGVEGQIDNFEDNLLRNESHQQ